MCRNIIHIISNHLYYRSKIIWYSVPISMPSRDVCQHVSIAIISKQVLIILKCTIYIIYLHYILVPQTLKPRATSKSNAESSEFKDEMENYISPLKSITYMLHSQHTANTKITITVSIFKELRRFFVSREKRDKNAKKYTAG